MLNRLLMLAVIFSLGAVALAGESTYSLTSTTALVAPSGAAQSGAITITNGWRGVSVGIFDQRDGSVGDIDQINSAVRGYAWIYEAAAVQSDGGGGWLRFSQLDVQGIADAGGIAAIGTEGVQGQWMQVPSTTIYPSPTGGLIDYKLYYTTGGTVISADAGTPTHKVTIVTHY